MNSLKYKDSLNPSNMLVATSYMFSHGTNCILLLSTNKKTQIERDSDMKKKEASSEREEALEA